MTELQLLINLHKNNERQGPGSEKDTLKALMLMGLSANQYLKVADIGCGSGAQTLTLAQNLNGQITAVDLASEFLIKLAKRVKNAGCMEKIVILEKSMEDLPFMAEEFDIFWSEGAIYNMGFEKGVKEWKKYIKPGGFLAVSEVTWITNNRPKEIEDFWEREYSEIDVASNKIKILEENGYSLTGYFYLSEDSWVLNYYKPLQERFEEFLERNNHSEMSIRVVQVHQKEIELYQKFKEYYSYGFYIARKIT